MYMHFNLFFLYLIQFSQPVAAIVSNTMLNLLSLNFQSNITQDSVSIYEDKF